jgi:hypothetical protein
MHQAQQLHIHAHHQHEQIGGEGGSIPWPGLGVELMHLHTFKPAEGGAGLVQAVHGITAAAEAAEQEQLEGRLGRRR